LNTFGALVSKKLFRLCRREREFSHALQTPGESRRNNVARLRNNHYVPPLSRTFQQRSKLSKRMLSLKNLSAELREFLKSMTKPRTNK
jgi:hypothetical protein